MDISTKPDRKIHHGHNIKRLREMLGVKQDILASELNISQQYVSELEQKETIDDRLLEKVAAVMNVPIDAIKNMTEETTFNYINTFYDSSVNHGVSTQYNFNPIDKIVELYNEKMELYERMLTLEKEKVILLESLLKGKDKANF